jgi:hypothetical protein
MNADQRKRMLRTMFEEIVVDGRGLRARAARGLDAVLDRGA